MALYSSYLGIQIIPESEATWCHLQWWSIVCLDWWLNPRYRMTSEGPLWCQLHLFQFGIQSHGIPAVLSGFASRMAHFVEAFTECVVLVTSFPNAFTLGFLNSSTLWPLGPDDSLGAVPGIVKWLAGLHPPAANRPLAPVVKTKNVSGCCQMFPGGKCTPGFYCCFNRRGLSF